jgi:uncharacterized protein involved in outer membrane biogenesis
LSIAGRVTKPLIEPNVNLKITSPNLDIDRLFSLPKKKKRDSETTSSAHQEKTKISKKRLPKRKKAEKQKLLSLIQKLIARLQVQIKKIQYQGNTFHNFAYNVKCKHGVLKPQEFQVKYGESDIQANGSMDLRDFEHISFEIEPDIQNLPLESMTRLLDIKEIPVQGHLTMSGHLKGKTDNMPEFLTSLSGNLKATVGQGFYSEVGSATHLLSKILMVAKIGSYFSGNFTKQLSSEGIPFEQIQTGISLSGGILDINTFDFQSNAMDASAKGSIDLIKQQLDVQVELKPYKIIDKSLEWVPFAEKLGHLLSHYRVYLDGPVNDPNISLIP